MRVKDRDPRHMWVTGVRVGHSDGPERRASQQRMGIGAGGFIGWPNWIRHGAGAAICEPGTLSSPFDLAAHNGRAGAPGG